MRRSAGSRRGQVIVILAVAIVPLTGIVSLGLDAGRAFIDARALQNAVDGAALAGAQDVSSAAEASASLANPGLARMDAMVFLSRNLGIMSLLAGATCNGIALTPSYFSTPASYSSDITAATCRPSGNAGVQIGSYQISIYQPPSAGSVNAGNPYAIEVQVTHAVPTTLAAVLGFTQLPVYQRAVAGSISGRWTFMTLEHFSGNNRSDVTLNSATLDVINGDVADNAGLTTNSNGSSPAIVNWWTCNPRSYGGGDPANDPACVATSSQSLYKWSQASASFNQNPNNAVRNLYTYLQDPGYAAPASLPTKPDCVFQSGPGAANYKNGTLTVPNNQSIFHIPPGAYPTIKVTAGFQGTVVLDAMPTASCPAGTNNSDKTPGIFVLGAAGQNSAALDLSAGTLVGNGVFLYVAAPGNQNGSNKITIHSGAQFYIDGRSDIFGYTSGPYCITSQVPPSSYQGQCQLAAPSPWGTRGAVNGVAQGDPISIMVSYASGATAANPGTGTSVLGFAAGSASDIQGIIDAPDDNVTLSGGASGSGTGRVIAFTLTYSSNNGKIIQEFSTVSPSVFGLLE